MNTDKRRWGRKRRKVDWKRGRTGLPQPAVSRPHVHSSTLPFICGSLTVLILLAPVARAGHLRSGSPLRDEPRLATAIDATAFEESFGEFLPRLGTQIGVALEAAREVENERVTLFARGRPARELLAVLAEHFDYDWKRRSGKAGAVLVLYQTRAARAREEALRRSAEARDVAVFRERFEEWLRLGASPEGRALALLPLEERQQRVRETHRRYFATRGDGAAAATASPERAALRRE